MPQPWHESFGGDGQTTLPGPTDRSRIPGILPGAALSLTAVNSGGNPTDVLAILPHGHESQSEPKSLIVMRQGHSRRSRRIMTREVADRLPESLRPTRHLLTRTLADIPAGPSLTSLWPMKARRLHPFPLSPIPSARRGCSVPVPNPPACKAAALRERQRVGGGISLTPSTVPMPRLLGFASGRWRAFR